MKKLVGKIVRWLIYGSDEPEPLDNFEHMKSRYTIRAARKLAG
jgi:hypothetical protein